MIVKRSFITMYEDLMSMDDPLGFLVKCASGLELKDIQTAYDYFRGLGDEMSDAAAVGAAAKVRSPSAKRRILLSAPSVQKEYANQVAKIVAEREARSIDPSAQVREVGFEGAESASREFGKTVGHAGGVLFVNKTKELYDKKSKVERAVARKRILAKLMKDDPIISGAEKQKVIEAYSTMVKTAPILSTDINAVRSFLRDAVQFEGGISFSTIADLARAEKSLFDVKETETQASSVRTPMRGPR